MDSVRPPAYLDHAATTPMSSAAIAAYTAQLAIPGNPSSLHTSGRAARRVVEESRESIATSLGARPSEIVLTGGGTEADNLAIKGLFWSRRTGHPERTRVVVSAVEHHAVLDPAFWLAEHAGAEIVLLPVDATGRLDLDALAAELAAHATEIALVSVMWANNEVGTIEPIADVVRLAHAHGIPVHSDAVQAVGRTDVNFAASGLDAMTVSAHKLGGPVGVGALVVGRAVGLVPVLHGGGQERGVRSGTLDAAGAHAFAVALADAVAGRELEAARLATLRDALVRGVLDRVPGATLRGPALDATSADGQRMRLPGNAHLTFADCEGDSLLYLLDSAGVEASTGSACQAGVPQPSHVLLALGVPEREARGALRFSLGSTSTLDDVERVLEVVPGVVERARAAGLAAPGRRGTGTPGHVMSVDGGAA
ncbi:cysteine desulfurase family protein [Sanguibacter sp. A247]|uniref:cysteine desulfurase family protein n=1 Tax=unclassified Sanguibacter TaxID=2645534 RepID=UPI003FD8168F